MITYKCKDCGKGFVSEHAFNEHVREHQADKGGRYTLVIGWLIGLAALVILVSILATVKAHANQGQCTDYRADLFKDDLPEEWDDEGKPNFRADCLRITRPRGGDVRSQISMRDHKIIIDGYCASACVHKLLLPDTCFTKRARFVFHGSYFHKSGKLNYFSTHFFKAQFPEAIQRKIAAITIPGRVARISNATMTRYMPEKVCGR